ncbi:hypothetical protein TUSST3_78380 [Streptomyces sp. TUS-ST3]|nr:hypothetical protein TUSST3_78380 [Streptomyces sp. TUS-ST3]
MLGDPQPAEVIRLPGMLPAVEFQLAEEQGPIGQLPHLLGLTAQLVPEDFGVRPGGGDVLTDDDLLLSTLDHGGERGPATVVVGALAVQGLFQGGEGGGSVGEIGVG